MSKDNKGNTPQLWLGIGKELSLDVDSVLRSNHTLVRAILKALETFEEQELLKETTSTDYDTPSWSHKQADRNGARRALKKVESLFNYLKD